MGRLSLQAPISSSSRRRLARWLVGSPISVVERDLVLETLAHTHGNRTVSARLLGVSVRTLRNTITEYSAEGLDIPRHESRDEISDPNPCSYSREQNRIGASAWRLSADAAEHDHRVFRRGSRHPSSREPRRDFRSKPLLILTGTEPYRRVCLASQCGRCGTRSPSIPQRVSTSLVTRAATRFPIRTLAHTHGNRTVSARLLGVSVRTLRNTITEYSAEGLDIPRHESRDEISDPNPCSYSREQNRIGASAWRLSADAAEHDHRVFRRGSRHPSSREPRRDF